MEVGADEGQQRDLTTENQTSDQTAAEENPPAAEEQAPSPGSEMPPVEPVQEPIVPVESVSADSVALELLHNDMQHAIVMDYWILGALMVIAGLLVVITFFTARGESSG